MHQSLPFRSIFSSEMPNNFVQSVVDARREIDENPLSGVVAETMKLLGNSSYGYQIMDRSSHTITKYLNDEKTHKAINEPFFKRLNTVEKTCMMWSCNQPLNTNLTSTNRGVRTINHMVATYEQTKKGLSYFYPKRQVPDDFLSRKFKFFSKF